MDLILMIGLTSSKCQAEDTWVISETRSLDFVVSIKLEVYSFCDFYNGKLEQKLKERLRLLTKKRM